MTVRNVNIDDKSRLSPLLPDNVKIAIADVIIAFGILESRLETLIWALCGLDFEHGAMLTTMDARPKIDLAKSLVKKHRVRLDSPPLPPNFWETAQDLRGYRNQIAHAMWAMADGDIPVAGSYRTRDQHGKRVVADAFSIERMEAIATQCANVGRYLERLERAYLERSPRPKPRLLRPE